MLINCGACENLRELLSLHANTRAIVVDSHRPIHHRHVLSDIPPIMPRRYNHDLL